MVGHKDEDGNAINTNCKELRVKYDFDKKNRVGHWDQICPGVRVQLAKCDPDAQSYAMRSFRRNVIHPSVIHKNGNPTGESRGRKKLDYKDVLIFPKPDLSFVEHLKVLRDKEHRALVTLQRYGISYKFVSMGFRSTIGSVINAVMGTHLSGRTLLLEDGEELTDTSFGLYGRDLRLIGVPTRQRISVALKGSDFNEVSKFITGHVFAAGTQALPLDMKDLINLLKEYNMNTNAARTDPLIHHHVATMSHSNRIQFMKNCFEKFEMIRSQGSEALYAEAINRMTPKPNWKDRFSENPPPGAVPPGVVIFLAVRTSFVKGNTKYNFVDRDAGETLIKKELIKCMRNMAVHLREHVNGPFSDVEIDTMLMAAFGDIVLEFEKCLAYVGLLDRFMED